MNTWLDVQVMETRTRLLTEEHPDTLTSMTNLASTYNNQGNGRRPEEKARDLLKEWSAAKKVSSSSSAFDRASADGASRPLTEEMKTKWEEQAEILLKSLKEAVGNSPVPAIVSTYACIRLDCNQRLTRI
jgi:hypothetical protein